MPDTRERIVQFLHMYRQASAAEMADAMGMTRANLRYHLSAMKAAGLIECAPAPQTASRGRPAQTYRLALAGRPDNLGELSGALLSALFPPEINPAETETTLCRLAALLVSDPPAVTGQITQTLQSAVRWLDAHRYAAAWEARPQGPALRLRNCPYAVLVANHPVLCRLDALLLSRLTGLAARQTDRIDLAGGHAPACVFVLHPRANPVAPG